MYYTNSSVPLVTVRTDEVAVQDIALEEAGRKYYRKCDECLRIVIKKDHPGCTAWGDGIRVLHPGSGVYILLTFWMLILGI